MNAKQFRQAERAYRRDFPCPPSRREREKAFQAECAKASGPASGSGDGDCARCLGTGEGLPHESKDGHCGYCRDCGGTGDAADRFDGWAVADPNGNTSLAGKPYGIGSSQTTAWRAFCKQAAKRGLIAQGWRVVRCKLSQNPTPASATDTATGSQTEHEEGRV